MSYHDIKLRPNDTKFSNYIREKAGWKCQKCGKSCKVGGEWIAKLEASHYIGRRKETTRFDPDNVYSLCFTCHKRMGGYTRNEDGEYDLWVKKLLGPKKYRALVIRANLPGKWDDKLTKMYIEKLTEELRYERAKRVNNTVC